MRPLVSTTRRLAELEAIDRWLATNPREPLPPSNVADDHAPPLVFDHKTRLLTRRPDAKPWQPPAARKLVGGT